MIKIKIIKRRILLIFYQSTELLISGVEDVDAFNEVVDKLKAGFSF